MKMNKYEELANSIIEQVCEKIEKHYPELKPKNITDDDIENPDLLNGTIYYDLESDIAEQIKKLSESTLKEQTLQVKQYVNEYIKSFRDEYDNDIKPFLNTIADRETFLNEIDDVIETKISSVVATYIKKNYEKDKQQFEEKFRDEVSKFIQLKNGIDTTITTYVYGKVKRLMEGYKNDKLDQLIRLIYSRLSQKYNIIITKEITSQMTEMGVLQTQTISEVMRCIQAKELRYKELAGAERTLLGFDEK